MRTKLTHFALCVCFVLFAVFYSSGLEAAGWGKTSKEYTLDGETWNGAYIELQGLNLTADIPNFDGSRLVNSDVYLTGKAGQNVYTYIIQTSYNKGFTPPKSQQLFTQQVQDANPGCQILPVDAKSIGAKYAVDVITAANPPEYWRYISTKDRLIYMGTDDQEPSRYLNFLNSVRIK